MRRYYTRVCNFYYGNESKLLVNSNKSIPLNGNKNISFDHIEIISRTSKKKISVKKINNLAKSFKRLIKIDLKLMKFKIRYWIQSNIIKINNKQNPKTLVFFTPIIWGIVRSCLQSEFKSLISKGKIVAITKINTCIKKIKKLISNFSVKFIIGKTTIKRLQTVATIKIFKPGVFLKFLFTELNGKQ